MKLEYLTMVTSPTGKGVIAMGGNGNSKAMFELSQSMEWTRLKQTLQMDHFELPIPIPIPDEMVEIVKPKKKSTKNHSDKKITQDNIKEWVKKKIVAKNMRKVDLVNYLESIGVKVTTAMKAKKDNLVQEVYNYFD